jgi:hypothetical protein
MAKSNYRLLQTIQSPKYQMLVLLLKGKGKMIEVSAKNTSKWSYEKVTIHVTEEDSVLKKRKQSPFPGSSIDASTLLLAPS